jgi:hypothetical protein
VGSNVTFTVVATGTAPLGYCWQSNGADLPGQAVASLVLPNVLVAQGGTYRVVVTNAVGRVTSQEASLTVLEPPVITQSPTNQTVVAGAEVRLSVAAAGTAPLSYQWRKGEADLPGETGPTLYLAKAGAANAGSYTVVASNAAGSVTSQPAVLTVLDPPVITQQPASQTVVAGANVTLQAVAGGTTPLSYQWRKQGVNLGGQTWASMTLSNVTSAAAGGYAVVVQNVAGGVTSRVATLTVRVPPSITQAPASRTVVLGNAVTLIVEAAGTSPLTYQWKKNGQVLAGQTMPRLVIGAVQAADAGSYTVEVGNAAGAVTSPAAVLTVQQPPLISQQPVGRTVAAGSSVTLGVTATGTTPLHYQWRKDGLDLKGQTSATLALSSLTGADSGSYSVHITNPAGSTSSAAAPVTVLERPSITQQPSSQTVAAGTTVSLAVTAAGTTPLSYQWLKNGTPLAGARARVLTLEKVQAAQAGSYMVVVTNLIGSATSDAAMLVVQELPVITQQPLDQAVALGEKATFSVAASGAAPLSYQWRKNGVELPGQISSALTLPAVQAADAGTYTVAVGNPAGKITSRPAVLYVQGRAVLRFVSWEVLPDDKFRLRIEGTGDQPCVIQVSTNLSEWVAVATNLLTQGVGEFIDSTVSDDAKYYRATIRSGVAGDSVPPTISPISVDRVAPLRDPLLPLEPGNVMLSVTAQDNQGVAAVTFFETGSVLGSAVPLGAERWSYSWPVWAVAGRIHTVWAQAVDAAGNQATTPPVSLYLADPNYLVPLAAAGTPLEGYVVRTDNDGGRLPAVEYRPAGPSLFGYGQGLYLRFPSGATLIGEGSGNAELEFTDVIAGFGEAFPLQLAEPLVKSGGQVKRLPIGPLSFAQLAQLFGRPYTEADPKAAAIALTAFHHVPLRWWGGVVKSGGIRGAKFSLGTEDYPMPKDCNFQDFTLDLTSKDGIRIPFAGKFTLPDGSKTPGELRTAKDRPIILHIRPDGSVAINGRVEVNFPSDGPRFTADLQVDDPQYYLELTAKGLHLPLLGSLAELLPTADACRVPAPAGATAQSLKEAALCLGKFDQLYLNFSAASAAAAESPVDLPEDPGEAIQPPDDVPTLTSILEAYAYAAQSQAPAGLRNLVRQSGDAAVAARDAKTILLYRRALMRAKGALGQASDADVQAALDLVKQAALQRAQEADAVSSLQSLREALGLLVETEALAQNAGPRKSPPRPARLAR